MKAYLAIDIVEEESYSFVFLHEKPVFDIESERWGGDV
jgi:hypothetical protein